MTELLYNLLFVDEVIALLTTAVGFVTLPALLQLINTPAEILDTAVLYGRIYLMGLPFLMPYDLSKECVMGCGDSKTPLKVIVATSAMNIVLDLVLVGPFGVAGAAAATAAAQVAGAVYMVAFLRRTQMDAAFSLRMLKARYARDIFRLSAPNSIQQASGTIITTVKQGLLGGLGVEAIAGFSCAGKLSSLLMMPVFGFVQSTVFFIAQNTAALQPGRVKEGLREGRRILLVYSLGVVAVCIGLRGPLLRLFTTDPAAASYGCTMLAFESVTCLFVAQKHLSSPPARCPEDGAVSGLQPGADRPEPAGLCDPCTPHWFCRLLDVQLDQRTHRNAAGSGAGEPLRHLAPAPLIGGLASPIRRGGIPQG